jgi:hypothetical protein
MSTFNTACNIIDIIFSKLDKIIDAIYLKFGVEIGPNTIDYSSRRVIHKDNYRSWGNNINWSSSFEDRRIVGWISRRPSNGDILTCNMQSGRVFAMEMYNVEWEHGVDDMFFADLRDLGYVDELIGFKR